MNHKIEDKQRVEDLPKEEEARGRKKNNEGKEKRRIEEERKKKRTRKSYQSISHSRKSCGQTGLKKRKRRQCFGRELTRPRQQVGRELLTGQVS